MKVPSRVTVAASALLALGLLAGCANESAAPAPVPTVESYVQPDAGLAAALAEGQEVRIGVLVGPVEGAGSEFRPLVEGANLAAYRFSLAGTNVGLEVALDDGTASGAASAVKSLLDKGVSGIVVASQADSHFSDALKLANAAGSAVISLYSAATDAEVWSMAAGSAAWRQAVADALAGADAKKPFVALASSREAPIQGVRTATIDDAAKTADLIKSAVEVALDDGTASGASTAVKSLLDREVSAIVVASPADSHLADALKLANAQSSAVISLYSPSADAEVWSMAAGSAAWRQAVADALAGADAKKPFVALASSREAPIQGVRTATIDDAAKTADLIKSAVEAREVDSVVVSAPAAQSAALVNALDARLAGAQIPIVVSAEALTPTFAEAVLGAGAAEGRLLTVGTTSVDLAALSPGEQGSAASAFFTSMRLAMGDTACMNLYGDDHCSQSMHLADAASHDAVVALVRAAEAAGSTEPAAVREALGGLSLTAADGLAGASLDFRSKSALPASELKTLHASTANPGMRPVPVGQQAGHSLFWFSE